MGELSQRLVGFRTSLKIDGTKLGEECLGQAVLYEQIGQLVADIKRTARTAKDTLDFTEARLKKEARQDPGKFGIPKVTESALDEAVKTHEEYLSAQKEFGDAQYLADCANVLLTSAEQRKSMLKDAVSMSIHQLYSSQHDLTGDQHRLVRATSDVHEQDIVNLRRETAQARQQEIQQEESSDV